MNIIEIRRRCWTLNLGFIAVIALGIGCGEEESIPADILDVDEIPCPSCDREQAENAGESLPGAGQSMMPTNPVTPTAEAPAPTEVETETSTPEPEDATAGPEAPTPETDVEITPTEPENVGPVIYDFNDEDSLLYVQVFRDDSRLLSGFSHNHVIRATSWTTQFSFDKANPANCLITATVPVNELRVDETAMRQLVQEKYLGANGRPLSGTPDYQQNITDNDRSQIRTSMLSVSQLNGVVYPNITLSGTNCTGMVGLSGETVLAATMTIKGYDAPVDLVLNYDFTNEGQALIRGVVETTHDNLGFEPYVDLGGTVGNAQALTFTLDLLGQAR